ncbi:MAG: hypothetical protein ACT4OF_12285 [Caulobacteraceae bacterium]
MADPADYAPAVAAATAYIYGADPAALDRYANLRAAAMHLRDSRNRNITDDDWRRIEELLVQAYGALRAAITRP